MSKTRWRALLSAGFFWFHAGGLGLGLELPQDLVQGLAADGFKDREKAEAALFDWSKEKDPAVRKELLDLHRSADDPEVRHRSLGVLKSLVTLDYLSEGSGMIGITMEGALEPMPEGEFRRGGILIKEVRAGTPAERADLKPGDLILTLNGKHPGSTADLTAKIGAMRPGTEVTLGILRGEERFDRKLRLMRKPPQLDFNRFMPDVDIEASDRAAKETFFRDWLSRQP